MQGTRPASTGAMRFRWAGLLLVLMTAFACSSHNSTPAAPSNAINLTGTWSGDLVLQGTTRRMTWTLTQSGTTVTGPVLVLEPNGVVLLNGTLNGTLSGSTMQYTIGVAAGGIPSQPSCTGQLGGTATATIGATSSTLAGNYTLNSSSCSTPFTSGTFTLTR